MEKQTAQFKVPTFDNLIMLYYNIMNSRVAALMRKTILIQKNNITKDNNYFNLANIITSKVSINEKIEKYYGKKK